MRYVYICWKMSNGDKYAIAHDLGIDCTAEEVAEWMRDQLEDIEYPTFAFAEISKEKYEWYDRRKLTLRNFRWG